MHRVIDIDLTGNHRPLRIHEDAYDSLKTYLDEAGARLGDDPDRAEVVDDLERSIGTRLVARLGDVNRTLNAADVKAVLDEVGAVEPPRVAGYRDIPRPPRRKLYRIKEGQALAGVCTGLAAYSDISIDLVRWVFFFGILLSGGLLLVAYVIVMFFLPVVATRAEWYAEMNRPTATS